MNRTKNGMLVGLILTLAFPSQAKEIQFGNHTWTVRPGHGGPGPNAWDENNVWLDSTTNLHLKISQRGGTWSCAEITMRQRLGFGQYQFQTTGRLDRLDDNVVLGLFLWLFKGLPPKNGQEVEVILRAFKFTPE